MSNNLKPATEILLSAAFVLTPKGHWTSFWNARNAMGIIVDEHSPDASCFCLMGALSAARETLGYSAEDFNAVRTHLSAATAAAVPFGDWNDTHTHAEVLDALYRAAELSEES